MQLQLWDIKEKEANKQDLTSYACPCKKCMGAKIFSEMEFKSTHGANPWFIKYMIWLKKNIDKDGNFLKRNIAGFIDPTKFHATKIWSFEVWTICEE